MPSPHARKKTWTKLAWIVVAAVLVLAVTASVVIRRAGPILKGRVVETLSTRFNSRVELGTLDVSIFRGLEVSGTRLQIYNPDPIVAAGAMEPLIDIAKFEFHSGVIGLFFKPMKVSEVRVSGMQIKIPPREIRNAGKAGGSKYNGKIKIVVETINCDSSRLIIGTLKPDKDPKDFELAHITLHDVGPSQPLQYQAVLTNAIPRGEIHATGNFGPWNTDDPGNSAVSGHYTFDHADLDTIKGIGGVLSSVGDFNGKLERIDVRGTTETPDFSLDTAHHPLPLHTKFHAVVDGTSGDTYLQSVDARLGDSNFSTSGAIVNIKGQGHRISLDLDVPDARLQDFLELAVKTTPPVMTAAITMKSKLEIRPGKESVPNKLGLDGTFQLRRIHFTNPGVQDKVDMLSLRAQGDPKEAKPGAEDVRSQMEGKFQMKDGVLNFERLNFAMPGAKVNLDGVYSLDGQKFEFHGKVLTNASLSEMVDSPWKSFLLKAVSPFFHRKGGGAEIPVSVSGTKSEPKFGLDVLHKDKSVH